MKEKNNIILLFVVLAIGGAALWYLRSLPTAEEPAVVVEDISGTENENGEVPTTTEKLPSSRTDETETRTVVENADQSRIDADVAAIAELSQTLYDDTSLDSVFTNDGANALTNGYDI